MQKDEENDLAKLKLLLLQYNSIVLDCDYLVDDHASNDTEICIGNDDVVIDGNGHTIDAGGHGRIFNVSGRNVTIKNITIRNAYNNDVNGSALSNEGSLTLLNVKFINNICSNPQKSQGDYYGGGAVYNEGNLTVVDSKFIENEYENMEPCEFCGGGAILNEGNLEILNTHFTSNKSNEIGGAILNNGKVILENSKFMLNSAFVGAAISNYGSFEALKSKFMKNESRYMFPAIYTSKNGTTEMEHCELSDGMHYSFDYLSDLMETGKEIVLDSDIVLDDDERQEYELGIEIDTDRLIIDGNNHCIDAKDMARFFRIIRGDIVLKNITFKNAFADIKMNFYEPESHSIITASPDCSLKIENCNFIDNVCKYKNNLILNFGKLNILNTRFVKNRSLNSIIKNFGELSIFKSDFESHEDALIVNMWADANPEKNSRYGRCILRISDSTFTDNAEVLINNDELHVADSKFKRNGVVLQNTEKADFVKSEFESNESGNEAIISNESNLNLNMCTFRDNIGGDVIGNDGKVKVNDCEFIRNVNERHAIFNRNYSEIGKCTFDGNDCDAAIFNRIEDKEKTALYVNLSKFINNETKSSTILNDGKGSVTQCEFENNHAPSGCEVDMVNHGDLKVNDLKIKSDEETIFNGLVIRLPSEQKVIKNINNQGRIIVGDEDNNGKAGFDDLNNLISKNIGGRVVLDDDIILKTSEFDFYEGGIELNVDGLEIDGQGHSIRGNGHSRMFIVTAKDVTLRNLIFEDGFTFKNYENMLLGGGCIQVNSMGSLTIENCRFVKNGCEEYGSAIHNYGKTTIKDAEFHDNKSKYGAICNTRRGLLDVENGYFTGNAGGAIENQGLMRACNCEFGENGYVAIHNEEYGMMEMRNSYVHDNRTSPLIENEAKGIVKMNGMRFEANISFSILNSGTLKMSNSRICGNTLNDGLKNHGKLKLNNILFRRNKSDRVIGMISNIWADLEIYDSKFIGNEAEAFGGLIANIGRIHAQNCEFQDNVSKTEGAINNQGDLKLFKCRFKNNTSEWGGAIFNSRKVNIKDTVFEGNRSNNNGNSIYNNFEYDRLIDERKIKSYEKVSYFKPKLRIENSEFFNEFPIDEEIFPHDLIRIKVKNCHYNNSEFGGDNIKRNTS